MPLGRSHHLEETEPCLLGERFPTVGMPPFLSQRSYLFPSFSTPPPSFLPILMGRNWETEDSQYGRYCSLAGLPQEVFVPQLTGLILGQASVKCQWHLPSSHDLAVFSDLVGPSLSGSNYHLVCRKGVKQNNVIWHLCSYWPLHTIKLYVEPTGMGKAFSIWETKSNNHTQRLNVVKHDISVHNISTQSRTPLTMKRIGVRPCDKIMGGISSYSAMFVLHIRLVTR